MSERTKRAGALVAVVVMLALILGTVYAADKERVQWLVADRATFLEGGVEFFSDVSFGDGALLADDGTAAAPGVSWASDTDSGWYRAGDNNVGLSLAGTGMLLYNEWGTAAITTDTTEYLFEILDSTPVMTGGTNILSALNIDLGIGNSTGGTNSVYGVLIDSITQDAQNTETAIALGDGWDVGLEMGNNDITMDAGSKLDLEDGTGEGVLFAVYIDCTYDVTTTSVVTLPANVDVIDWAFVVSTAYNDSGTDVMVCGTSGDSDKWVDDLNLESAGRNQGGDANDMQFDEWATSFGDVGSSDVGVLCVYTGQNGNASAGAGTFILWYRVD